MLHLILLVLCWIFVAVATVAMTTMRKPIDPLDELDAVDFMFKAVQIGTPIWLALEGVYYLANRYLF